MSSVSLLNLAIVDDRAMFGNILRRFLLDQGFMNVSILSSDVSKLMEKLKSIPVNVLITDAFDSGVDGPDALKTIRSAYPSLNILAFFFRNDPDLANDLLNAGIYGLISKSDEPEDLVKAILSASEDRLHRGLQPTGLVWPHRKSNPVPYKEKKSIGFNDREKKILQLMWEEKSNKEIADELFLGVRSIEKIRQDMKERIGARSTIGLFKFAIRNKIINVGLTSVRSAK